MFGIDEDKEVMETKEDTTNNTIISEENTFDY